MFFYHEDSEVLQSVRTGDSIAFEMQRLQVVLTEISGTVWKRNKVNETVLKACGNSHYYLV